MKVNKISPASGTAITLGDSGDTFTIPSGATIANSGTATGFLADDAVTTAKILNSNVTTAKIADNAVTLAKMAGGTDGQIITYDASGDPVAVGPGTDGQVLTSTGAGSPPAFEDAGGGLYSSVAILADQKASNTHGGTFTSGAWRTRDLNTEISDVDGIVSISSNQFTLQAGTYTIEWACTTMETNNSITQLYNVTDTSTVTTGFSHYTFAGGSVQSGDGGSAVTTIGGAKAFEIRNHCGTTVGGYGFGHRIDTTTNTYCIVKILKHA